MMVTKIYSSETEVFVTGIVTSSEGEVVKIIHGSRAPEGHFIMDVIDNNRSLLEERKKLIEEEYQHKLVQTFVSSSYSLVAKQVRAVTQNRIKEVLRNERNVK